LDDLEAEQEAIAKGRSATIKELIAELDGPEAGTAFRALSRCGSTAIAPLVEALPTLGDRGQLYATELFERLGDDNALSALTPLLSSADSAVRASSVEAFLIITGRKAAPASRAAYEGAIRRRKPSEERALGPIRRALSRLRERRRLRA
jgi:hypothetical protein